MIPYAALITQHLQQADLPELLGVYAFGSRMTGQATPKSDFDLAVLVAGYAAPDKLWELSDELAEITDCPVGLLDFRAASTVMQHRILTSGERWWAKDWKTDAYEAAKLNEMLDLSYNRANLLENIAAYRSPQG